jgi:hypothetical protein
MKPIRVKPVRLVSTLCAVAVVSTCIAAWASATESASVTCELISEMSAGQPGAALLAAPDAYAGIPLAPQTPSCRSSGKPAAASACDDDLI